MKVYLVGGAVRDWLLGNHPKDNDFVVVGSTPEKMLELGFTQVGKDFPVFLHPVTKDEFALARTDRKTGIGHTGFTCDWEGVTLEQDLKRRDLTVNAIAIEVDYESYCTLQLCSTRGELIDPFGGKQDLGNRILRHVSPAFEEDPLRVLRIARFAACLESAEGYFTIHEDTRKMMNRMSRKGMLDDLTPERVWKEMEKVLKNSEQPSIFFNVLMAYESLFPIWMRMMRTRQPKKWHPEGNVARHTALAMDYAAKRWHDPVLTFAVMCHDFGKPVVYEELGVLHGHEEAGVEVVQEFCKKYRVPNKYRDLAVMVAAEHGRVHKVLEMKPKSIEAMLTRCKSDKKGEQFLQLLRAAEADNLSRPLDHSDEKPHFAIWCAITNMLFCSDTKEVVAELREKGKVGAEIKEGIRIHRITTIRKTLKEVKKSWNL